LLYEEVRKMEYTIVLHPAEEGGYWAEVPALPGCYSQGETVEKTLMNIKEAVSSHLIALKAEGRQPPRDQTMVFSHVEI
jgi:predicted RNase H-like HicB family nuclease